MTKVAEKLLSKVQDAFTRAIELKMKQEFNISVSTTMNYDYNMVTSKTNGENFTTDELHYLAGFSEGYKAAQAVIEREVYK